MRLFDAGPATESLVEAGLLEAEHVECLPVVVAWFVALEVLELCLVHARILK